MSAVRSNWLVVIAAEPGGGTVLFLIPKTQAARDALRPIPEVVGKLGGVIGFIRMGASTATGFKFPPGVGEEVVMQVQAQLDSNCKKA